MKRLLFKVSGALLRAHRYLDWRLKMGAGFTPRRVRYPERIGTKKIVHVIGNFIVGGSTQLIVDIIEGTSDEYCHKIVVPHLEERLAYGPVDIHAFAIEQLRELSKWLANEQPEIVHIHYFVRPADRLSETALWYETVFRICEELELKVVQNVNVPTFPHRSAAVVHNVFVSHYVERRFNSVAAESSVIYPGSDFAHFRNDDVDSLPAHNIGMVYRLDDDKLRPDAIEVFIEVARKHPGIRCYIAGGGSLLNGFQKRVREERLGRTIQLTGFVGYDELPALYRKFSIFVAPVHEESFGQVVPFAMSMGLCVAGYDTGALSEILGSRETLVRAGNVGDLAQTIVELANDAERRKSLARGNVTRARDLFSVQTMIGHFRELYDRVVSTGRV